MKEKIKLSNRDYRIIDILHQIEKINSMILLHSAEGGISFMKQQYEEMKTKLLLELKEEFDKLKIPIGNTSYAIGA